MRVLLVEPNYRRASDSKNSEKGIDEDQADKCPGAQSKRRTPNDETLWYPPLGLMKLARFHKERGDEVKFVRGCDKGIKAEGPLFSDLWDRVYITTLFTFHFKQVVDTIRFYLDAVGGTVSRIYVGGIMASLMAKEINVETGVSPVCGTITAPRLINLTGEANIDLLPPDYSIMDPELYAVNDTYYAYTTRGCSNKCAWCGVPVIEPQFIEYIDIKPMIRAMRNEYGDKSTLRLMDNNVLASSKLSQIVDDLEELGYGRGQQTETRAKKHRVIDFNQGLDASFLDEPTMRLLARLNIRPMRIAFDRITEKKHYVKAVQIANSYGVPEISNYMLYNFKDTPRDLYERLMVNIKLNEKWIAEDIDRNTGKIYSYPMRFAPIFDPNGNGENKKRDLFIPEPVETRDWLTNPSWTRKFIRNVELMKGAAHGMISNTPSLARRTIGQTFEEFLANLYMPEELIRNRNKHEKRVYEDEPKRTKGTGKVEEFREFILRLLKKQDSRFKIFHEAVNENSQAAYRHALKTTKDREIKKWLKLYIVR